MRNSGLGGLRGVVACVGLCALTAILIGCGENSRDGDDEERDRKERADFADQLFRLLESLLAVVFRKNRNERLRKRAFGK